MKRWRFFWIGLAVAFTVALAGTAAYVRASVQFENDDEMARRESILCRRHYQEMGLSFEAAMDRCYGPYRRVYGSGLWESRLRGAVPFGLMVAAGFWLIFGLLFFGVRHLRGGGDEPEA